MKDQHRELEQTIAAARGIPMIPATPEITDVLQRFYKMAALVVFWERGRRWARPGTESNPPYN